MLDVLDKELEKRGHRFVRYADDCNIYVRNRRAGERVMAGIEKAGGVRFVKPSLPSGWVFSFSVPQKWTVPLTVGHMLQHYITTLRAGHVRSMTEPTLIAQG